MYGKEDGADQYDELKCSANNLDIDGIQTYGDKNRHKEQPVSAEQLKFIITIATNKMNDEIVYEETKADIT